MKEYGSLTNRLEENCYFSNTKGNIQVGTPCTIYSWSDTHPYEVIEVINQEHLIIRQLDAKRIDKNGMSDCQEYEYSSNPNNWTREIKLTKYGWKEVMRYNLEKYNIIMKRDGFVLCENSNVEKVKMGKEVATQVSKINISFGIARKYFDYSF